MNDSFKVFNKEKLIIVNKKKVEEEDLYESIQATIVDEIPTEDFKFIVKDYLKLAVKEETYKHFVEFYRLYENYFDGFEELISKCKKIKDKDEYQTDITRKKESNNNNNNQVGWFNDISNDMFSSLAGYGSRITGLDKLFDSFLPYVILDFQTISLKKLHEEIDGVFLRYQHSINQSKYAFDNLSNIQRKLYNSYKKNEEIDVVYDFKSDDTLYSQFLTQFNSLLDFVQLEKDISLILENQKDLEVKNQEIEKKPFDYVEEENILKVQKTKIQELYQELKTLSYNFPNRFKELEEKNVFNPKDYSETEKKQYLEIEKLELEKEAIKKTFLFLEEEIGRNRADTTLLPDSKYKEHEALSMELKKLLKNKIDIENKKEKILNLIKKAELIIKVECETRKLKQEKKRLLEENKLKQEEENNEIEIKKVEIELLNFDDKFSNLGILALKDKQERFKKVSDFNIKYDSKVDALKEEYKEKLEKLKLMLVDLEWNNKMDFVISGEKELEEIISDIKLYSGFKVSEMAYSFKMLMRKVFNTTYSFYHYEARLFEKEEKGMFKNTKNLGTLHLEYEEELEKTLDHLKNLNSLYSIEKLENHVKSFEKDLKKLFSKY